MKTTASAYVKDDRLCIVGLHECALGPIPFAYSAAVEKETKSGPVDLSSEEIDPKLSKIIEESQKPMLAAIEREKMRVGAEQLVERTRAGDQNARAMILEISQSAEKGNKRARKAAMLLREYIEQHPADQKGSSDGHYHPKANAQIVRQLGAHVGDDAAISAWTPGIPDLYVAALIIASGPVLKKERVVSIGSHFGEDVNSFWSGFKRWDRAGEDQKDGAVFTGRAVGLARTIQGVREGALPVSKLSPMAGWELGE